MMADALCGPSNALQSFQKHTSVDRTLQQDRLALRQSPAQVATTVSKSSTLYLTRIFKGFRSPQPNVGILDADFEAFQAGHPFGDGLPTFEPPQYDGPASSNGHDFPHPQLPDWASDFQKLHLGEARSFPIPQSQFRHEAPLQRNLPGGWQQDFTRQQGRQTIHQQPIQQQFNGFGQSMHQNRSYPMFDGASSQLSPVAQLKQPQQEDVFDEEAFERAFEAANAEVEQVQEQPRQKDILSTKNNVLAHTDPIFQRPIKELENDVDSMGHRTLIDYQMQLMLLEQQNKKRLLAARQGKEMRWNMERKQWNMVEKQQAEVQLGNDVLINESADLSTRSDHLVEQERIGSDRVLQQDDDPRAETQLHDEADDLARTAGQLLDSVKHDQSQKFQQSSFLALMRQLRDREVRVEGNRMVDVSTSSSPTGPKHFHPGPAEMITCRVLGCERVDD